MSDLLKSIDARTKLAGTNKLEILLFFLGGTSVPAAAKPTDQRLQGPRGDAHPHHGGPDMPSSVEGMVSLRGVLAPVVDLAKYTGVAADTPRDIMIVTEYAGHTQGFLVEGVDTILRLDWARCAFRLRCSPPRPAALVTAVTELDDGRLVMMMDVERCSRETTSYDDEIMYRGVVAVKPARCHGVPLRRFSVARKAD